MPSVAPRLIEPELVRGSPAALEEERSPIVGRVPGDDGQEQDQSDRRREVRPRFSQTTASRRPEDHVEQRPGRQQDGVILAEHRTTPGRADPEPWHNSVGIVKGDGQSVESQEPEEEQWTVRLGDRGNRHPKVAGGAQGEGREKPGPPARRTAR